MFGKKTYKAQNSRRYKRLRAGYLVKYHVAGNPEDAVVTNLKDLSAGGAKFWTDRYVAEGSLVKVSLLVPPLDLTVETLARVVRVRQTKKNPMFYAAVSFVELSQAAKIGIEAFIEYLASLPDAGDLVSGQEITKRTILV